MKSNIYVIARVTVFQDPLYAKKFPSQAIQSKKRATTWLDRNNLPYIDPSSKKFWDYIVRISKACKLVGFDEINYDYIRFPTDGNLKDMLFPISGSRIKSIPSKQMVDFTKEGKFIIKDQGWEASSHGDEGLPSVLISPKAIILTEIL